MAVSEGQGRSGPVKRPSRAQMRAATVAPPTCAHCQRLAQRVPGSVIWPNRPDLADKAMWECRPCNAWVGSHPNGKPLGRPGNYQVRKARQMLHGRFDPIWEAGIARYPGMARPMAAAICRNRLYRYLAHLIGLEIEECHIAMFDLDQCRQAWTALSGVTYDHARNYAKGLPNADDQAS